MDLEVVLFGQSSIMFIVFADFGCAGSQTKLVLRYRANRDTLMTWSTNEQIYSLTTLYFT